MACLECRVGCLVRYSIVHIACTRGFGSHIAHVAHIAWSWGGVERVILQRVATVRLWARHVRQGCSARAGGLQRSVRFGRASACLRHGDCLVGPELSLLAHRVLDTLRRSTRMQRFSTARVSASKILSSGRARHSNPWSMRANFRHVVQVVAGPAP